MRDLREERVLRDAGVGGERGTGDGAVVERGGVVAFGEEREVHAIAVLGRGHAHDLEEAAEADGDLTVEGVGVRQEAAGIGIERDDAVLRQVREPGLAVVRVGREKRPGQRAAARFVVGARHLPGQVGGAGRAGDGEAGAGRGGEDGAATDQGEGLAAGQGHGALHMVRYRTI